MLWTKNKQTNVGKTRSLLSGRCQRCIVHLETIQRIVSRWTMRQQRDVSYTSRCWYDVNTMIFVCWKKKMQRLFRRLIKTIQACHQCQPYTFSHISTYSLNDKHLHMSKTCHWNTFFNIIEVSILCFECIFGNCREPMKWVCPLVSQDALTVALTEETTKEKKTPKKTQGYKMEKQMHDYGLSLSWNPPVTPPATV